MNIQMDVICPYLLGCGIYYLLIWQVHRLQEIKYLSEGKIFLLILCYEFTKEITYKTLKYFTQNVMFECDSIFFIYNQITNSNQNINKKWR